MKIVIVGAGAIGSLFAAYLLKTKEEILILEKTKERAAKINQHGINIESANGSWRIKPKATADLKDIDEADLIMLCVKAYDTKETINQIKNLNRSFKVIYGGSVSENNVKDIANLDNLEGFLVGTDSFNANEFFDLCKTCDTLI